MGRALLFIRRYVGSSKAAVNTARMVVVKVAGEWSLRCSLNSYFQDIEVISTVRFIQIALVL